jgi:hypothetical protein
VFENRVLRKIFVPKKDEITGQWRRLHNKELYYVYSSPNIIPVIKSGRIGWAGLVAHMRQKKCIKGLVGKPVGKKPRKRPRPRWDNIIM